jgi:hypothetical protein
MDVPRLCDLTFTYEAYGVLAHLFLRVRLRGSAGGAAMAEISISSTRTGTGIRQ